MADKKQDNNQPSAQDPAKSLLQIVHGDVKDLHIPHKSIVTGKKLKNDVLKNFVDTFMEAGTIDAKTLIQVILILDEAVEKEHLTEDLLEAIRKDPSLLENLLDENNKQ